MLLSKAMCTIPEIQMSNYSNRATKSKTKIPFAQSIKYTVLAFGFFCLFETVQFHFRLATIVDGGEYLHDNSLHEEDLGMIKDAGRGINLTPQLSTERKNESTMAHSVGRGNENANVNEEAKSTSGSDSDFDLFKEEQRKRKEASSPSAGDATGSGSSDNNSISTKPKLVLHVGPRKTATTTIQYNILKKKQYQQRLKDDNFIYVDYEWSRGLKLVEKCSQGSSSSSSPLQEEADIQKCSNTTDEWNDFVSLLDDAYENEENAIVSNEALSLLQFNEAAKATFLTLTKKWDVRVIVTYRPLETWYPSMYFELRTQDMYNKQYRWYRDWPTTKDDDVHSGISISTDQPITEWFARNWKKVYLGDPLQTLQTYREIFGANKVKILTVVSSSSSHGGDVGGDNGNGNGNGGGGDTDITEQFLCEGLEAKKTCDYAQRMGAPKAINTKEEKKQNGYNGMPYDHDLLTVQAYKRGLLDDITDECTTRKRYNRPMHVQVIQKYMEERGMKVVDLPHKCVSRELMDDLEHDSRLAELDMAPTPRSEEEFLRSMTEIREIGGTYCNIDVSAILSDTEWRHFFVNDMRLCQKKVSYDDDYGYGGEPSSPPTALSVASAPSGFIQKE